MRILPVALCMACSARGDAEPITTKVSWEPALEVAKGGGLKGPWQQHQSKFDYVDDPVVALLPDRAVAVAWVDQRARDVRFQIYERDGKPRFRTPVDVSKTPQIFSWLPRIVVDGRDVGILWQEIVFSGGSHGGEMLFARSTDGGATFERAVNLSHSVPGDGKGRIDAKTWSNGSFDLVRDEAGTLHAAWTEYDGALRIASSKDRGATWSAPRQLAGTRERPARAPALAAGPRGLLYLAWTTGEDAAADIVVARAPDGRTFGKPIIVERTPGYSDAPKLAVDGKGALHVAFADSAGGPADRYHVRYTRSRDGGRTFERTKQLSRGTDSASYPSLAVDERGNPHLIWDVQPDPAQLPRGLAYASSTDGGSSFGPAVPIPGSADPDGGWNGSHQGRLMDRLDVREGTIVVGMSALRPGHGSRVWLVRGRARVEKQPAVEG